jgi:PAS domain S-box-containing protein
VQAELIKEKTFPFLQGGGEMGALTRSFNWSETPIGTPDQWPQNLRTTLSIILNTKFPMFLWWGDDLIQFYNDAYRPSLGNNGKHPAALGQRGEECWPEIWPVIKPLIDQVFKTGEATWSEDQLIPIYRNGKLEDVYWTFGYSPVQGETGKTEGVLVVCNETTEKVKNVQRLRLSDQRFQNLVREATVGIIILNGKDMVVDVVNETYARLFGCTYEELINQPLFNVLPETEAGFRPVLEKVRATGAPVHLYEHPYFITKNGLEQEVFFNLVYQPFKENDQKITGVMVLCHEVSDQVNARKKIEESEQQVRSIIESAPFPIGVYTGKEMRIQFANQSIIEVYGKGPDVIGKLYPEVLPELGSQEIFKQLDSVYTTGIAFHAKNQQVDLVDAGKLKTYFFNYSFTPLLDSNGNVYGVMNTAADVTDLNLATKKIEESERNLRNIILQAPVAMCILRGPRHVVEIANGRMFELWGKGPEDLLNRPIFSELPEAREEGFEELLDTVFTTGKTFTAYGVPVSLPRDGGVETVYINFVYEAFREGDGSISGVMAVATDVTEQVLASKKIESSESRFRLMADAMPQFVWMGDAAGNLNYFNQAVYNYSGLSVEQVQKEGWLQIVHPEEREENIKAWAHSIQTGEDFVFHHRFKNKEGEYRWQLSRAVPQKDSEGNIQLWIGTSTDIHEHKLFEEELNRQVQERTIELEEANQTLVNTNRELQRSNANLEEFAHAASHDLKEPIRKIHFFTDRLKNQLSERLNEEDNRILSRIENSSQRMASLIDDLLLYSHVSQRPLEMEKVDLNEKLRKVLDDLELDIQEKKAVIRLGDLPTVSGHRRQLQQLFQNLVSNALKYNKAGTPPEISITSSLVKGKDSGFAVSEKEQNKSYYYIEVSDKGIGFEQANAERIFQMFTRLHGNAEYRGTGVGLSIARKVVENHSGYIAAISRPGEGATFRILLPA